MQTQFHIEEVQDPLFTPPVIAPTELAVEQISKETTKQTHNTEVTPAVHQWLAKIQRKAQRDKRRYWGLFIFFQAFIFVPISLTNIFPIMRNGHFNLVALAMMFTPAIGMMLLALWYAFKKPDWNAEELMRIGGVQAVGTLIDLIQTPKTPRQTTPLLVALTNLLPLMQASDAALLTAEQRKLLYWIVKGGFTAGVNPAAYLKFRLAILKALEQIGDAGAIPVVTSLANGWAYTVNQKALKAAAQECLPLLQSNFGSVEATKSLLRASQSLPTAPELLLRSAEFIPDANPKTLLRPADVASPPPAP